MNGEENKNLPSEFKNLKPLDIDKNLQNNNQISKKPKVVSRYVLMCDNFFLEMLTNNFNSNQFAVCVKYNSIDFIKKQTIIEMFPFSIEKHIEYMLNVYKILNQAEIIKNLNPTKNFCLIIDNIIVYYETNKSFQVFLVNDTLEQGKIFCVKTVYDPQDIPNYISEKNKILHEIYTYVMNDDFSKVFVCSNETMSCTQFDFQNINLKNKFNKLLEQLKNFISRLESEQNYKMVFIYKNMLESKLLMFTSILYEKQMLKIQEKNINDSLNQVLKFIIKNDNNIN